MVGKKSIKAKAKGKKAAKKSAPAPKKKATSSGKWRKPTAPARKAKPTAKISDFESLAIRVEELADKHGINPEDVPRFADVLADGGLEADQVTRGVCRRAREIRAIRMEELYAKYPFVKR